MFFSSFTIGTKTTTSQFNLAMITIFTPFWRRNTRVSSKQNNKNSIVPNTKLNFLKLKIFLFFFIFFSSWMNAYVSVSVVETVVTVLLFLFFPLMMTSVDAVIVGASHAAWRTRKPATTPFPCSCALLRTFSLFLPPPAALHHSTFFRIIFLYSLILSGCVLPYMIVSSY